MLTNFHSNSGACAGYCSSKIGSSNNNRSSNGGGHLYGPPSYKEVMAARNGYSTLLRPGRHGGNTRQINIQDVFTVGFRNNVGARDFVSPPLSPNLNFRANQTAFRNRDGAVFVTTPAAPCYNNTATAPSGLSPLTATTAVSAFRGNDYPSVAATQVNSAAALRDRDFINMLNSPGVSNCCNGIGSTKTPAVKKRERLSMKNSILGSPRFHRRNMLGEHYWSCMQACR